MLTTKVARKPKRHYVNNADLYASLVAYRAMKLEKPKTPIPNYVGECIMLICEKLSLRPNFSGYSWREDMVGDAIENTVAAVGSFNPARSKNPFAYFTQVAWNAMIRRIQREKKQSYAKCKNMEWLLIMGDDVQLQEISGIIDQKTMTPGTAERSKTTGREAMYEVIKNFEDSLSRRKRVNKRKRSGS